MDDWQGDLRSRILKGLGTTSVTSERLDAVVEAICDGEWKTPEEFWPEEPGWYWVGVPGCWRAPKEFVPDLSPDTGVVYANDGAVKFRGSTHPDGFRIHTTPIAVLGGME